MSYRGLHIINSFAKTKFLFTCVYLTGFTCVVKIQEILWAACVKINAKVERLSTNLHFGRGSRVSSRGSRVKGRGSKNYSKIFSNYFLTSSIQIFTGSCLLELPVPVFFFFFFVCHIWVICLFVKNFYIPTDSPACWTSGPFNFYGYFFSGLRIRIIAEDNANVEDADCWFWLNYQFFLAVNSNYSKILIIWSRNPMVFFSNVLLAYEKVSQINPWISEDILSFKCPQDSNAVG